jgi:hypothetical protein
MGLTYPGYSRISGRNHPLTSKCGTVAIHRKTLYDKIGPGIHVCHWCNTEVEWMHGRPSQPRYLVTDHLDDDSGNNAPENLVPSCCACNSGRSKGRGRLRPGESFIISAGGRAIRAEWFYCCICGKSYLSHTNIKGLPYKKTCSRSCANKAISAAASRKRKPVIPDGALFVVRLGSRHVATKKTCEHCNNEFITDIRKARFCSSRCFHDHRISISGVWRKCEVCAADFKVRSSAVNFHPCRTCSHSCREYLRIREGRSALPHLKVS